jgi:hypothetical protein
MKGDEDVHVVSTKVSQELRIREHPDVHRLARNELPPGAEERVRAAIEDAEPRAVRERMLEPLEQSAAPLVIVEGGESIMPTMAQQPTRPGRSSQHRNTASDRQHRTQPGPRRPGEPDRDPDRQKH